MAKEYGVDRKTFYLMLKRMDVSIPPGLILPKFQELIYNQLGKPKKVLEKELFEQAYIQTLAQARSQYVSLEEK